MSFSHHLSCRVWACKGATGLGAAQVDLAKVNMDVIKHWIAEKLTEYLGFDEEVTINMMINSLEQDKDAKKLQLQLTEFIGKKKAASMTTELWTLLTDAMKNPSGVPTAFIEAKKQELAQRAAAQVRIAEMK
jgi:serine/arginine repetitive matrix protein 1